MKMESLIFHLVSPQPCDDTDMPVGYFEGGAPREPGYYGYMPFRGLGNLLLGEALEAGEQPICFYSADGITVRFRVAGRTKAGTLHLIDFTTMVGS